MFRKNWSIFWTYPHFVTISVILDWSVSCLLLQMQVWDTAGQERFRTITQSYYRSAHGAMVAYDITRRGTFESVPHWIREVEQYGAASVVLILIGKMNKIGWSVKPRNPQNQFFWFYKPPRPCQESSSSHHWTTHQVLYMLFKYFPHYSQWLGNWQCLRWVSVKFTFVPILPGEREAGHLIHFSYTFPSW